MGQEVVVSQDQVLNISGHNAAADWRHPHHHHHHQRSKYGPGGSH